MSIHPRHTTLFELLRRQNMADRTCQRLSGDAERRRMEAEEVAAVRAAALASWARPGFAAEPVRSRRVSAPEPRRDYEFFRAVGA